MLPKKRRFDYAGFDDMRYDAEPLDLTVGVKRREPSNNSVNNVFQYLDQSPCTGHHFWNIPIASPTTVYPVHEGQKRKSRWREMCKMPMNAFMMFSKKHRSIVRERNPGRSNREISKILSDCWYSLRPEERKHYNEFASELKLAYHEHCRSISKLNRNENETELTHPNACYLRGSPAPKDVERISILEMGEYKEKFSALPVFDVSPGKRDEPRGVGGTVFPFPDFNTEEIHFGREEGQTEASDTAHGRKVRNQRAQLILQLFQQRGFFPSEESVSEFQTRYSHLFRKRTGLQSQIRVMRQKLMACKSPSSTA